MPSILFSSSRRRFVATAAAASAVSLLPGKLLAATRTRIDHLVNHGARHDHAIRPFHVHFSRAELVDLRRRIHAIRWPERETVADNSQGVKLATIQPLAQYWGTDYDWRKIERHLNALPQYKTNIDGLDIQFIHVRSKHAHALPVIVTHGWPGSIIEQLKIIGPLTNPTVHGASASDAFDVVVPSIPGYGFSDKPTTSDWDTARIARAWVVLMKRLGYKHFVAQGGDFGAVVTELMAEQAPPELLGIHVSLPATVPPDIAKAIKCGDPPPSGLSAEERRAYEQLTKLYAKNFAYSAEMHTRPQTLYGLSDSPVGLAAWLLDHGDGYDQPAANILAALHRHHGHLTDVLTRDDVLDNITLYWLTNTGISAARSYWLNKTSPINAVNITIPAAVTVFPGEIYQAPRSWTERAYHNLIYFHKAAKGGHFAAWEQPEIFSHELRASFRPLRRKGHHKVA